MSSRYVGIHNRQTMRMPPTNQPPAHVAATQARPLSRRARLREWWRLQPGVVQGLFIACALCTLAGLYGCVLYGSAGLEFIGVTVGSTIFVLAVCWVFDVAVKAAERALPRNRVVGAAGRLAGSPQSCYSRP